MRVSLVHIHVKPEHVADFIAATRLNHLASVREAGNLRFDVLQSAEDPTRFVLYEAYSSAAQSAAHKQTPHYLRWRDTVAEWMAAPRVGIGYTGLCPDLCSP
jgi:autoinducer 2-degrading protein